MGRRVGREAGGDRQEKKRGGERGKEGGREGEVSLDLTLYQHPHPLAGLEEIGDVRHPLKDVVGAAFHEEEDVSRALLPTEEGLMEGGDGEGKRHFMSMPVREGIN